MNVVIELKNVDYSYKNRHEVTKILENVSAVFEEGKVYALMGTSGSGKTTTLSLLGGLDTPESGQVLFSQKDIKEIGYYKYRNQNVGFVFQAHNLLGYLSVIKNVEAVMDISHLEIKNKGERAAGLLKRVGISEEKHQRNIAKLSGGEQQRVAIARALATDAPLLLADEPTGNLDYDTAGDIIEVFRDLAHKDNKCVIVATHSKELSERADKILYIDDKSISVRRANVL